MTDIHEAVYLKYKRKHSTGEVLLDEKIYGNDRWRYEEVDSITMRVSVKTMVHFEVIEALWNRLKNNKKKIQNWLLK